MSNKRRADPNFTLAIIDIEMVVDGCRMLAEMISHGECATDDDARLAPEVLASLLRLTTSAARTLRRNVQDADDERRPLLSEASLGPALARRQRRAAAQARQRGSRMKVERQR